MTKRWLDVSFRLSVPANLTDAAFALTVADHIKSFRADSFLVHLVARSVNDDLSLYGESHAFGGVRAGKKGKAAAGRNSAR